jgi:Tol biopolymer transport system component
MRLTPGSRLGQYEVVSAIGAGGMGEVFRARDTRLQRDVALKVLPDLFAADPERLARFQREAQVLASLNDRNIAAIYGFEESETTKALVLELVEGPTLADHLVQGPMPVDDAVAIARQIADALETAHAQGIIHRDLKPSNVKVRPDGMVKVLDFGLAKAFDPARPASGDPLDSPTITAGATQLGMVLGTAAYMAPEQAKGKPVDKRADIWAFGCVLYEMLAGRRAFAGEDTSDTLAFVITKEPDWSALPADTPAPLRRLLRRCLEKDRKRRLADISDARLELDEALTPETRVSAAAAPVAQRPDWRRTLPWAVAMAAVLALIATLVTWAPWRAAAPSRTVRASTHFGADVSLAIPGGAAGSAVTLSRQGDMLAFTARAAGAATSSLWVRRLDELTASMLAGTEGAAVPFFSPDGRWLAFFADGKLKKIAVTGGIVSTLANAPEPRGGDWADDGTIVFTPDRAATPIFRVPSAGGRAEPWTSLGPEEATHRYPQVLPSGKALLYTAHNSTSGFDAAKIVVKPLPDGSPHVIVDGGYYGRYVASGHLLYMRGGVLHAVPFDLERLEATGPSAPILESVRSSTRSAAAHIHVAGDGTAVYVEGGDADVAGPILWMTKQGTTSPLRTTPAVVLNVRVSPDGRQLAIDNYDGQQWDIWTYDWERDKLSRLTDDPALEQRPVWTADGTRIVYASIGGDASNRIYSLLWQRADRSAPPQRLTQSDNLQRPASWHPSGRFLAFMELNPQTSWDVWMLPIEGNETTGWKAGTPTVFVNQRSAEMEPMFSPDGRFVAYQSYESGQAEIYVRPFPGPGGRELVSAGGGAYPQWAPHDPELLYVANGKIMAARYTVTDGVFRAEKPRPWTDAPFTPRTGPVSRSFDLHPDGTRFAFASAGEDETGARRDHVVLVFNFFDELRRLAPPARR